MAGTRERQSSHHPEEQARRLPPGFNAAPKPRMASVSLSIDTSRPIRSRADHQALVRAVFEALAGTQETDWLEWKGPLELGSRNASGRAAIAKAVLGFSNRDPDLAARNMRGCAYVVAGVSPGELHGVAVVDAAQLEGQVAGFVGRDISWRADYVEVDGCKVLVVTVEPPQWGDAVHPARKTFNPDGGGRSALQEGTIYVRHQASTERATAADMDMLSRRAARRPGDQLAVDVRPAPETSLQAVDLSQHAMAAYVEQEENRLLAPLSPAMQRMLGLSPYKQNLLMGGMGGEHRTETDYRQKVSEYLEELREALPQVLRARALLHEVARLKLEVVNNTDNTFTGVRIEALLRAQLTVTDWPNEVREEGEPPPPPTLYGQGSRSGIGLYGAGISVPRISSPLATGIPLAPGAPDVERKADGVYVDYAAVDVRAQGVTPLPSVWLRVEDPDINTIPLRWEATATNADKRLSVTLSVPVTPPPASVEQLMQEVSEDED